MCIRDSLQKTQTAKETLEGKALFERKCATFDIKVHHYHSDNGVFAALMWEEACATMGQSYSYSGVNSHFQSGVAERRIWELQGLARTMPMPDGQKQSLPTFGPTQ